MKMASLNAFLSNLHFKENHYIAVYMVKATKLFFMGFSKQRFYFLVISLLFASSYLHASEKQDIVSTFNQLLKQSPDSLIVFGTNLLREKGEQPADSSYALTCYYLGIAYYYKAFYYISAEYYNKALSSNYAKDNIRFRSRCLNNLGIVHDMTEEYHQAIHNYLQAYETDSLLNDSISMAQTKINIALLYCNIGQSTIAEKQLNEAMGIFRIKEDKNGQALAYQNLGKIAQDNGDYEKSITYLQKAIQLYRESRENYELAIALISLSSSYLNIDKPVDSETAHLRSLRNCQREQLYLCYYPCAVDTG